MNGRERIAVVDGAAGYLGGVLLAAAGAWEFATLDAGTATEKEKAACAVLALGGLIAVASVPVARASLNLAFVMRSPTAVAGYAMTGIVSAPAGLIVYVALVPLAVSVLTLAIRVMEEARSRPVSHL